MRIEPIHCAPSCALHRGRNRWRVAGRTPESAEAPRTVTIYVSTDRVFSEPVLRAYERQSGVTVNAVYDTEETKSTGLANRLLAEQARPQADVFWSNEPVRTLVLKSRNVLAPYRSPNAEGIPTALVDPDGYWTGFSARIRVIAYNTTLVKAEERRSRSSTWPIHAGAGRWRSPIPGSARHPSTSPRSTPRPVTSGWTTSSAS